MALFILINWIDFNRQILLGLSQDYLEFSLQVFKSILFCIYTYVCTAKNWTDVYLRFISFRNCQQHLQVFLFFYVLEINR